MHCLFYRPQAQRLAWWLIGCMALASLHSALAAILVLAHGGSSAEMVEVCTNQGVRWVSLQTTKGTAATNADAPEGAEGAEAHADGTPHCPLCRFVGDDFPHRSRSDLRFAPPLAYRAPPPGPPRPPSAAECVVLTAPPRAPPTLAG